VNQPRTLAARTSKTNENLNSLDCCKNTFYINKTAKLFVKLPQRLLPSIQGDFYKINS